MADIESWVNGNWFTLVQSAGIVGSLCLAAAAFLRDAHWRRVSALLTLGQEHRELWTEVHRRPELRRVLGAQVDLVAEPVSVAEREFVNLAMTHFHTSWLLSRDSSLIESEVLQSDVRWFFSLPVPHVIWQETRHFRDPGFVRFVELALADGK